MTDAIVATSLKKRFKTHESLRGKKIFLASLRRRTFYKQALDDVGFSIPTGQIVALLGKNGSGKSTLTKIMTGILFPDSGEIKVLGLDPWRERVKLAMEIGVVLGAHGQLFWNLPASDAFEYNRKIYKVPESTYEKRLSYFVDRLELEEVYKRQVRQMSLGEQMKCNFVSSCLHMPRIVFLDEPTIGVDLPSKLALRETISEMQRRFKTTFVLTTHIVEDIAIAERVIMLDKGKKIFDDTKENLEGLFGDKRYITLKFDGRAPAKVGIGKVLEREANVLKLEVPRRAIKSKGMMSLLNSDRVMDYSVNEVDLSHILSKLYRGLDGKKRTGGRYAT
ncbi:MAG TPA: ATP-binding cassette domain-containing protein [Candidatus Acidoferrales bacterium]|nr:ATP-binding cassette domain-containing protein [Candidatus Acidoferrales bacterium]